MLKQQAELDKAGQAAMKHADSPTVHSGAGADATVKDEGIICYPRGESLYTKNEMRTFRPEEPFVPREVKVGEKGRACGSVFWTRCVVKRPHYARHHIVRRCDFIRASSRIPELSRRASAK